MKVTNAITTPPRKQLKFRRRQDGFSIVEVSISMLLITVTVIPLVSLMLLSRRVDMESKTRAAAYNVARQQIETLRSQAWGNRPDVSQAAFTIPATILAEFPDQTLQGDYNIVTTNATYPRVQQIAVRVRWNRRDSAQPVVSSVIVDTLSTEGAGK